MTRLFRRLPPLSTLVAFEAACRLGSFTRAADELALSQASVSRRVRELEQDLGVTLFKRRRYDVVPTQAGEGFARVVCDALRELAAAAESQRARGRGEEQLTVFSDMSLGATLIAPCIGAFQREHPRLRLRVISSYDRIESLGEKFDFGLQCGRWAEDQFDIEPIADDEIFPVCAPAIAATLPSTVDAVDVAKLPLLHLADVGRDWPDWRRFLAFFRLKEPKPIEGLNFSSYQVCLDVAEQGEGVALGWGLTVNDRLTSGRLVRIHGLTMPLAGAVNIYRRKGAKRNAAAERFIALVRESVADR